MGMTVKRTTDAARVCERMLLHAAGEGSDLLWLLPSYDRVLERRKQLADKASPLRLGCTVSTLADWVEDAWALWGDGRALVSSVQRRILMGAVLEETPGVDGRFLPVSAGRIDLFCRTAQTAAAFEELGGDRVDRSSRASALEAVDLTPTQKDMLSVLRAYYEALDERNLCEPAQAMRLLAACEGCVWPRIVCEGLSLVSPEEALFLAALSERADVLFVEEAVSGSRFDVAASLVASLHRAREILGMPGAFEGDTAPDAVSAGGSATATTLPDGSSLSRSAHPELSALAAALYDERAAASVEPQGGLCVLLPAGRYAEPSLLVDAISQDGAERALVACSDPARMFADLSEALALRGFELQARWSRPFAETDFGRVLENAFDMALWPDDDRPDVFQASDYLFSEFSEKGLSAVYSLDARWRARRSLSAADVRADLAEQAARFAAPFAALVREGSFAAAFDLAEERYRALSSSSEAFRAEQLAAVACAREAFEQMRPPVFPTAGRLRAYLKTAHVPVSLRVPASASQIGPARLVRIMSCRDAACEPAGSYDAVFSCDMNAASQPVRLRTSSADALFEAFGVNFERDVLFESRLAFVRLLATAQKRFYPLRRLNDPDAAALHPSISFEELMACYPGDPDKLTGVAASLLSGGGGLVRQRGEEHLMRNVSLRSEEPACRLLELGAFDEVSPGCSDGLLGPVRLLSPSAIEEYLDCPYKWFARRRLRLCGVDAGFSALEKGSFVHEVLKRFHLRHADLFGRAKPRTGAQLEGEALPLLREVFSEVLADQKGKDPSDNPLVPLTQSENAQTDELLRHLEGFVRRDATLLPTFEPRFFERSFGRDEAFEYAGMPLCGSIDRVDVDEQGRAVVVDYKSSLGDAYQLLPAGALGIDELPAKVQALVYAQVARRALGLEPVAALYVHVLKPGSQPPVCGAYDDRLLGPDDLPGLRLSRSSLSAAGCVCFGDLLDRVEDMVAVRLADLRAGRIGVDPRTDKACAFCPVLSCEGRRN